MKRILPLRRPATAILTALVASLAIAACGGSSHTGSKVASIKNDGLRYAACMRAHGVPDYPDPGASRFGGNLRVKANRVTVNGHALAETWTVVRPVTSKCQKYIDPSFGPRYSASQLAKVRAGALAMSKCMRAHGVDYPDLSVAPGPDGHGVSVGFGRGLTKSTLASPAFNKDNVLCSKLLTDSMPGHRG